MPIRLEPASSLSLPALTALFNAGYAGYIVPVHMAEANLRAFLYQYDIALDRSWIACDGDQPVGFALLGLRPPRGWVGAVGIAADYRRQGLGRRLMRAALDTAREIGLTGVQLEVIVGNDAAHALYLSLGLRDTGRLLVLERAPAPLDPPPWPGVLEPASIERALAHFDALHNVPNPWQRQPATLARATPPPQAWLALQADVVQASTLGYFSDDRLSLLDVGLDPAHPQALAALLTGLHQRHPQATGRLVNLDANDNALPVLEALGYRVPLSQNAMRLDF